MPLVINSLGGGHTHTNTYTDICTEIILRNQVCAGHRLAHAWFKNYLVFHHLLYMLIEKSHNSALLGPINFPKILFYSLHASDSDGVKENHMRENGR